MYPYLQVCNSQHGMKNIKIIFGRIINYIAQEGSILHIKCIVD